MTLPDTPPDSTTQPTAEALGNLRLIFWIVPLYALMVGFFLLATAFEIEPQDD